MASGRSIASRRFTRAKAACTRRTSSRSSVSGRAMSCGVCAHANAPTSISRSRGHAGEHVVERLVGQRADLVAGERLDRMLHHDRRSEEHTSELQSRPHLVCRLLLAKKKNEHSEPPY